MMTLDFTGRTILITGGASGMGLEEARYLSNSGAHVWIADINQDNAEEQARELSTNGAPVMALRLDVSDPSSWKETVATIEQESGRLDGLINNAGMSLRKGMLDTTDDDWSRVLSVNLDSVFYGMKYCHPLLLNGDQAAIVNISSITGALGYFAPAYGTSKWGVRGLTQAAALEFAADNIRVNAVCPGLVESPLLNAGSNEFVDESVKGIPLNRIAQPGEVAQAVAFLLSPAASYITGTDLAVDGGLISGGTYKQITDRLNGNR